MTKPRIVIEFVGCVVCSHPHTAIVQSLDASGRPGSSPDACSVSAYAPFLLRLAACSLLPAALPAALPASAHVRDSMGYSTITSDGDAVEYGVELEYDVLAGAVNLGPGSREARNDAERVAALASQTAALTDYLDDRVQLFLDGARCEFALAGTSVGEREAVPYASSSASAPAGILVGHPEPQRPQRVVRLRLHRPGCAPEHLRDLLLGQVLVEPQHHHRPLPRRQARHVSHRPTRSSTPASGVGLLGAGTRWAAAWSRSRFRRRCVEMNPLTSILRRYASGESARCTRPQTAYAFTNVDCSKSSASAACPVIRYAVR